MLKIDRRLEKVWAIVGYSQSEQRLSFYPPHPVVSFHHPARLLHFLTDNRLAVTTYKYQLSLNALHHDKRAANKGGRSV